MNLAPGAMITTTTVPIRHWPIGRQMSSPLPAAEEKTAIEPPWKTLRVSHFPSARLRLGFSLKSDPSSSLLLEAVT